MLAVGIGIAMHFAGNKAELPSTTATPPAGVEFGIAVRA